MTFVITQACVGEVKAACFAVCPVDCIQFVPAMPAGYPGEGKPMAVIDPEECTYCGACEPECPVMAIVDDKAHDPYWAEINRRLAPVFYGQRPPK